MIDYQWIRNTNADLQEVKELSKILNIPVKVAQLLAQRGITRFEDAKKFFRPVLSDLHDPFLMKGMHRAVERLTEALSKKQKIMIYGDYDVDGTTSVALMFTFLKDFSSELICYQPDRYSEGYGISFKGIDFAKENDVKLIIALDCGTRAIDKIKKANDYGIDVVVCDHHTPGEELPDAHTILNPKQKDCPYPFKELCGCGIGFKLVQAFVLHQGHGIDEILPLLDFVVVAIGADIVPVTGENRVLAYYGLKQVNESPRLGIRKLLDSGNRFGEITISDLVFTVAPRINAAGRISHAQSAVEMLLVTTDEEAEKWSQEINAYNTERRELDQQITAEALMTIKSDDFYDDTVSNVVWSENWHKGVVGIVASRLIENYYKPTIVFAVGEEEATGSARSIDGFDVLSAIEDCQRFLTRFGGHKFAAGLSLKKEDLPVFRTAFDEAVKSKITSDLLIPKLLIDLELTTEDLMPETPGNPFPKLFRLSEQFSPFGPGNMRPVFLLRNLRDSGYSKIVKEDHMKVTLKCERTGQIFSGIAFGLAHKFNLLQKGSVDVVFSLAINTFRGSQEMQLEIKDIKEAGQYKDN